MKWPITSFDGACRRKGSLEKISTSSDFEILFAETSRALALKSGDKYFQEDS